MEIIITGIIIYFIYTFITAKKCDLYFGNGRLSPEGRTCPKCEGSGREIS